MKGWPLATRRRREKGAAQHAVNICGTSRLNNEDLRKFRRAAERKVVNEKLIQED